MPRLRPWPKVKVVPRAPGRYVNQVARAVTAEEAGAEVRDMRPEDTAAVAGWRYDGPWSVYDQRDQVATAANGYHAIVPSGTGELLGYFCVRAEARVPGLAEEPGAVDVGFGLGPAIVGRGRGASIIGPALVWLEDNLGPQELRVVVQSWNQRSLRLCRGLGFEEVGCHQVLGAPGPVDYVVLRRTRRGWRQ
jgi:[ribosomal protein S18]-alanine N-acetyltransferase